MLTLDRAGRPSSPPAWSRTASSELWARATLARVIGWGTTSSGRLVLAAPARSGRADRQRRDLRLRLYGADFDPETMVCAGDPPGTRDPARHLPGRLGRPAVRPRLRLDPADPIFATAGVVSWGIGCADTAVPGHLHPHRRGRAQRLDARPHPAGELRYRPRRGRHAARDAVLDLRRTRTARAASTRSSGTSIRTASSTTRPGASLVADLPAAGQRVIGLEASGPSGDVARFYGAFNVAAAPVVTPPPTGGGGRPRRRPEADRSRRHRWSPASRRSSRPRA